MGRRIGALWKYSGRYRYVLILLPVVLLVQVLLQVRIPLLMGDMLDIGLHSGDIRTIMTQGLDMALTAAALMLSGLLSSRLVSDWSAGVTENLRNALFAKVQQLSESDMDRFGTASVLTRLSTDMNYIRRGLGMFHSFIRNPMTVVITVAVTVHEYPQVSEIFLTGAGLFLIVNFFVIRFSVKHYRKLLRRYDDINAMLEENITAQKTVKAFAMEKEEESKFNEKALFLRGESRLAEGFAMLNEPLLNLVMDICILVIVLVSSRNIVSGSLQTGDFFCLITYANQILYQIAMIGLIMVSILNAGVAFERVLEIVDSEPSVKDGQTDEYDGKDASVVFENVSLSYHPEEETRKLALRDIDLRIEGGEFFGVIGSIGAGKTSMLNLILRFCEATGGCVKVGSRDVRDYTQRALRTRIGFVPQKSILFSGTIADNLRWGNENAGDRDLVEAASIACANDFIMAFPDGYNTVISQGGTTLSGGQRQRLCLARALVKKPSLLILDDSFSAVDSRTESSILKSLSEHLKGTTVILVSQRFSCVRNADRIAVLDKGAVVDVGTHDELLERCSIYREIHESQKECME